MKTVTQQLTFEEIKNDQYKLPLSQLLGIPNENTELRDIYIGRNATTRNILLRSDIDTVYQLGDKSIDDLLHIKLLGYGRVIIVYSFYASLVANNLKKDNEIKQSLWRIVQKYSLSDTLDCLFSEFIPNSDLNIRGVSKHDSICDGKAHIAYTKIQISSLVNFKNQGVTDLELLKKYPQLTATDLTIAFAYAATNKAEIEQDIANSQNQ